MVRFPPSQTLLRCCQLTKFPALSLKMGTQTRSSNARKQPGLPDAPRKRRTKAQIAANNQAKDVVAKSKKAEDEKAQESIAMLEQKIANDQEHMRQGRVKNVKGPYLVPRCMTCHHIFPVDAKKNGKDKGKRKASELTDEESNADDPQESEVGSESSFAPEPGQERSDSVLTELEDTPRPKKKLKGDGESIRANVEAAKVRMANSEANTMSNNVPRAATQGGAG